MRIAMQMSYTGGFIEEADRIAELEAAGLDAVFVGEAYSFDAVSQLGYLAARTTTLELCSGILNVYSRSPALLAMTAAGLDEVSGGRFTLGLGSSGPQVVEGFHGVAFASPLGVTREVVDICRRVWRRETLQHDGRQFHVPLDEAHGGSGLGKPLKLINTPVRERVPMVLAAMGPRNVALAAELFEGWEPLFYYPEGKDAAFGEALAAGTAVRDSALGPLRIVADTQLLVTDDAEAADRAIARVRQHLALYVGGMGARNKNFYNDLMSRYGFEDAAATVQNLYLDGHKDQAVSAIPDEFVRGVSLIGPLGYVAERVAAFAESGVEMVNAQLLGDGHADRLGSVERIKSVLP